jgi:predicted TPR repeat methyltransferase
MLFQCGRFHDAADTLAEAASLDPTAAGTRDLHRLATFVRDTLDGRAEATMDLYAGSPACSDGIDIIFKTTLLYLDRFGHKEAAGRAAESWVACRPDNPEARHLRDAALSRPVARMPADLVARHFDAYAATFDEQLTGHLGYEVPDRIAALLAPHLPAGGGLSVLDIGCGTGLCAVHLRPHAHHLAGVDLAPRMIDKARERGLYDRLDAADLLTVLEREDGRWDVIVAGDVLTYFGALEPVFDAVARALAPGGWFAFTTENADVEGFVLHGSGRYAHGNRYIAGLAAGRLDVVEAQQAEIRREGGRPVKGDLYLLRAR